MTMTSTVDFLTVRSARMTLLPELWWVSIHLPWTIHVLAQRNNKKIGPLSDVGQKKRT